MTSSNRHWPSMFKSKPNHHELNSGSHRSGLGNDERTPEPKPRWNPRPEQIRILEAIFNSGMVNPPRDEIRKIRAQLQEFGQVGDANVFYWFQNRKSRSKHKQRHAAAKTTTHHLPHTSQAPPPPAPAPSSYSTSSSDRSSTGKTLSAVNVVDLMNSNSPTASVNNQQQHPFVPAPNEFLSDPFFFPTQDLSHGFGFSGGVNENCQNFLLSELMLMSNCPSKTENHEKMKLDQHLTYSSTGVSVSNPSHHFLPPPFSAPNNQILQGLAEPVGPAKSSTVFINDVCFEVGVGPFSVREAFGDEAVLIHSSGQPVLTDEWGFTAQPLQHGGFYYLMRPFAAPSGRTIDLI